MGLSSLGGRRSKPGSERLARISAAWRAQRQRAAVMSLGGEEESESRLLLTDEVEDGGVDSSLVGVEGAEEGWISEMRSW